MPQKASSKTKLAVKGLAAIGTVVRQAANARSKSRTASRSTTITGRKIKFQTLRQGGATTSVFSHKNPCPKYMKQVFKQHEDQSYITNTSARVTATTGKQALWAWTSLDTGAFGAGDIGKMMELANGGALSGNAKTLRIYLGKSKTNYLMTNNQTNNIFVDMYDVVARKDQSQTILGSLQTGLVDQGITGGSDAINVTPFMSQLFCTNWKIVKRTSIELGPGESHRHVFNFAVNKQINAERMQDASWYYEGITHGTLIVAWGAPCHDATNTSLVSTGSVLLDCVMSKQMQFYVSSFAVSKTQYVSALGTITTERAVNEESGTAATVSS